MKIISNTILAAALAVVAVSAGYYGQQTMPALQPVENPVTPGPPSHDSTPPLPVPVDTPTDLLHTPVNPSDMPGPPVTGMGSPPPSFRPGDDFKFPPIQCPPGKRPTPLPKFDHKWSPFARTTVETDGCEPIVPPATNVPANPITPPTTINLPPPEYKPSPGMVPDQPPSLHPNPNPPSGAPPSNQPPVTPTTPPTGNVPPPLFMTVTGIAQCQVWVPCDQVHLYPTSESPDASTDLP